MKLPEEDLIHLFKKYLRHTKDGRLIRRRNLGVHANRGQLVTGWVDHKGYRCFEFFHDGFKYHRVVFALEHGYFPEQIDHVNRKKLDNRVRNLRASNPHHNTSNKGEYKNNTSGVTGVVFRPGRKPWLARRWRGGKHFPLGCFKNKEDAVRALRKFDREYAAKLRVIG